MSPSLTRLERAARAHAQNPSQTNLNELIEAADALDQEEEQTNRGRALMQESAYILKFHAPALARGINLYLGYTAEL